MSDQLLLIDLPGVPVISPAKTPHKPRTDYDPMTDMWGEPATCEECGSPNRRNGAYIFCRNGHWTTMQCFGQEDHPRHQEFAAYRRSIGHPID